MCVESEEKGTWNRTWWGHQTMGKAEEEKHTKEVEQGWPGVKRPIWKVVIWKSKEYIF